MVTSNKHMFIFLKLLQLIKCCHNSFLRKLKEYIKETHSYTILMCDDLSFINTTQKTLKPSKNVSMPRMDKKNLHTQEFQLKGSCKNMRCKLLQKRFIGKTTECSKHLRQSPLKKIFYQNLTDAIFKYI